MTQTAPRPAAAPITDLPKWFEGYVGVLDLETTEANPLTARIVSYASLYLNRECEPLSQSKGGLVNPGVPIPEGATAVHGITDEMAQTGVSHDHAIITLLGELSYLKAAREPLVIYNAAYDLTILHVQARALGRSVPEVMVLDPLVIDRSLDPYRKGSRKLADVCAHYGVVLGDAHDARADALATARLMFAMVERWPQLRARLDLIHESQVRRQEEWAASFERYRRKSDPEARVERGWPVLEAARGIVRTEQQAVFDVPEKPQREAKRYDIPAGAVFKPCRECEVPVTFVHTRTTDEGKKVMVPVTQEGVSHYMNCTNPKRFSKGAKA